MTIENLKLIAPLLGLMAFMFGLYQYWRSKPIFKFRMFHDIEPNTDECGNYLCARVLISNSGGKTGVFNGFVAVDKKGEEFYPMTSFKPGEEIEPEKMITGVIPIGHLITNPPKAVYMQDGLLNKKRIPDRILKKTIKQLEAEKERCEKLGFAVHPTKGIKKNA